MRDLSELPAFFDILLKTKTLEVILTLKENDAVILELVNEEKGRRVRLDNNGLVMTMPYAVFYRFSEALMKTAKRYSKKSRPAKKSLRGLKARYKLRSQTLVA